MTPFNLTNVERVEFERDKGLLDDLLRDKDVKKRECDKANYEHACDWYSKKWGVEHTVEKEKGRRV